MKFRVQVIKRYEYYTTIDVEANDEDEARDLAEEKVGYGLKDHELLSLDHTRNEAVGVEAI